ncbi:hypothetical protein BGZ61DRAFT_537898 [Ilyonectria robusta]|uniref:uncharacterized protein n=1 Tax=Ilyonectria robusta TaxID=1079257 RepID=UPI001E8EAD1C|nr:uncharacterized protein BGZ61DRAFT_537898 [Ilyonectria robusta]KAH8667720.1 hypothetical protein BGZ61DRAFT_537898 [Ilyonectria robusta]
MKTTKALQPQASQGEITFHISGGGSSNCAKTQLGLEVHLQKICVPKCRIARLTVESRSSNICDWNLLSYSPSDSEDEDAPEPKRPKDSDREFNPTLSLSEEHLCGDAAELDDVQEPSPIQDLAAALGKAGSVGKFVRLDDHATENGNPIGVSTVGSYKMSIWNLGIREDLYEDYFPLAPLVPNLTIRITSTTMAAFGVATRACQLTNINTVSSSVKERLGVGMPASTSTAFSRAYMGFSAYPMGDTYMTPGRNIPNKGKDVEGTKDQIARPRDIDLDDSAAGTQCKVEPGSKLVGANLIWHERCLVPGAIQTLKQLVHFDTPEDVQDGSDARLAAWAFLDREHTRALNGIQPTPYGSKSPTDKGPNQPTMKERYVCRGSDTHFMLKWPPLAVMEVPREM